MDNSGNNNITTNFNNEVNNNDINDIKNTCDTNDNEVINNTIDTNNNDNDNIELKNNLVINNVSNLDVKINNTIEDVPIKEVNLNQDINEIGDNTKNNIENNTENNTEKNFVNEITNNTKNKLVDNSDNDTQIVKDKYQKYIEICKKLFNEIKVHFKNLNSKLSILSNKVDKIKMLCSNLNNKKTLYNDDHINNLVFQANLISGDINYLSTIKKSFLNKFHNDIFNLANNIILFISSITSLEIDDNDKERNHIIKKVTTIKKINDVNIKLIEVYLDSILKNLSLVDDVCLNFTKYINKINNKINTEHFHCNNLNITLSNKKNNILLEFNKNRDSICRLLEYYANFTNHVEKQINNLKISDFCLNEV